MLTPPTPVLLAATLTLAVVLTLSLRVRPCPPWMLWLVRLAELERRSRTARSSSRIRCLSASFSCFSFSSSERQNNASSYRLVLGIIPGESSLTAELGVAIGTDVLPEGGARLAK